MLRAAHLPGGRVQGGTALLGFSQALGWPKKGFTSTVVDRSLSTGISVLQTEL